MSALYTDVNVAWPHASLLAYFRSPATTSDARDTGISPGENTSSADPHQLLYPYTSDIEESKYGFWGESDGAKSSSESDPSYSKRSATRSAAAFCCLWCAFSVIILGAFGLYFAIDLAFSHYGLGTGMAEWIMYRHQFPPSTVHGIRFCLETPNREAPGPQAWHYLTAGTDNRCTTKTIDFILNPKEAWKVQPDAILVLRNEKPYLDRREQIRAPAILPEQMQALKLGDDMAEEGRLGRQV